MRRGSGINKGTDPEQSAKRVQEGRQGRNMRVLEISGKDVHNMKARSRLCCLIKRGPNSVGQGRRIQDLRGGKGVQGVQGCLGEGPELRNCTASPLRSRFQQAKWLRVPPFGACRGPPPPQFEGVRRGNLPSVQHATTYIYVHMPIYSHVYMYFSYVYAFVSYVLEQ